MLRPTALQRLFHWQGERAVARGGGEVRAVVRHLEPRHASASRRSPRWSPGPRCSSSTDHKDQGLNASLIERCKAARFDAVALTVDTIVAGKRERCLRAAASPPRPGSPPARLVLRDQAALGARLRVPREVRACPTSTAHVSEGSGKAVSIAELLQHHARHRDGLGDRRAASARTGAARSASRA